VRSKITWVQVVKKDMLNREVIQNMVLDRLDGGKEYMCSTPISCLGPINLTPF
jgi:hypothetical protein